MPKIFRTPVCILFLYILMTSPAIAEPDKHTNTLIQTYDLEVAQTPIKSRRNWRSPKQVLVFEASDERLQWLGKAVPNIELINASGDADLAKHLKKVDAVMGLCNTNILKNGTQLRWIQLYTAGVEKCVNDPAFAQHTPLLTNMQRIAAPVIAEHAIAMMMSLSRQLPRFHQAQDRGEWQRDAKATAGMQVIKGKTLLVVGLGGIGTEVARRAHALGMIVNATRASSRQGPDFVSEVGLPTDLPRLIESADVVVNALPLVESTRDLFTAKMFKKMKASALFINVGRGGTVVTNDLVAALENGALAGAGLDVVSPEPLPANHALWQTPNTLITPHVASRSDLGREDRWLVVRENLRRYVNGEPMLSVVDAQRGY